MVHEVQRGETIIQIARQYGFRSWETIWAHANNAGLRSSRPNAHILKKGDQLFIPDKQPAEYQCATNQKHIFRVSSMKQHLEQVLLDAKDRPIGGKKFQLVAGGKTIQGRTGSDGLISEEIPLSATTAKLQVWLDDEDPSKSQEWDLKLGDLDPVETTYGLKGHLANLGYDCGTVDDDLNDQAKDALKEFQRDHNLTVSGENDQATQQKLREIFNYPVESTT